MALDMSQYGAIVAHMELSAYVDRLRNELLVAAQAGGEEARALAERLIAPLDSATRLVLLEAMAAAADEITRDLAPGSVEVRLRGQNPSFVVTPPPTEEAFERHHQSPGRPRRRSGPKAMRAGPRASTSAFRTPSSSGPRRLPRRRVSPSTRGSSGQWPAPWSPTITTARAGSQRGRQSYTGWVR